MSSLKVKSVGCRDKFKREDRARRDGGGSVHEILQLLERVQIISID